MITQGFANQVLFNLLKHYALENTIFWRADPHFLSLSMQSPHPHPPPQRHTSVTESNLSGILFKIFTLCILTKIKGTLYYPSRGSPCWKSTLKPIHCNWLLELPPWEWNEKSTHNLTLQDWHPLSMWVMKAFLVVMKPSCWFSKVNVHLL